MGGEMIQQVMIGPYAEILFEKLGSFGTHPPQKLDIGIPQPVHYSSQR